MAESAEFNFDNKQWQKFIKKLRTKWKTIQNRKEFGGIISATVYADIIEHFDDERGPNNKWEDWSTLYEKHLKKIGRAGNKKLQFSGKLRQTFTPQKWIAVSDGILFFNNAVTKGGFPYAYAHDTGGPKLPQRKFMWLSNKGLTAIIDKTERWILEDL